MKSEILCRCPKPTAHGFLKIHHTPKQRVFSLWSGTGMNCFGFVSRHISTEQVTMVQKSNEGQFELLNIAKYPQLPSFSPWIPGYLHPFFQFSKQRKKEHTEKKKQLKTSFQTNHFSSPPPFCFEMTFSTPPRFHRSTICSSFWHLPATVWWWLSGFQKGITKIVGTTLTAHLVVMERHCWLADVCLEFWSYEVFKKMLCSWSLVRIFLRPRMRKKEKRLCRQSHRIFLLRG